MIDFYDQNTGDYIGQASVGTTGDGSGSATATWYGFATGDYNLGVGSSQIPGKFRGQHT
jgi:hypothetical protein